MILLKLMKPLFEQAQAYDCLHLHLFNYQGILKFMIHGGNSESTVLYQDYTQFKYFIRNNSSTLYRRL